MLMPSGEREAARSGRNASARARLERAALPSNFLLRSIGDSRWHEDLQILRFPVYFTAAGSKFPARSIFVAFLGNDQGNRTTAIRTAASFVTSMILSPFRLSIWLFTMK